MQQLLNLHYFLFRNSAVKIVVSLIPYQYKCELFIGLFGSCVLQLFLNYKLYAQPNNPVAP